MEWQLFIGKYLGRFTMPVFILAVWYIADRILAKIVGKAFDRGISSVQNNSVGHMADYERLTRVKRLGTLRNLVLDVLRWGLGAVAILTLMSSLGVNIMPILTGLGIAGLAISLAAQNIIRDFLNGIFVVIEDHFAVGDVVKIGEHFGLVENFTLRTTHLSDLDGNYIIIPNSNISELVNATKYWSQAQVVVGVSYDTDIRKALGIMERVAREIKESFPGKVKEDAQVQGILSFDDSAVSLRTLIRTFPGEHWFIGREYRLRLKEAFDAEGITIPFPQMDIWIRSPEGFKKAGQKTSA
ncbi:MAG: mechanosensitive ion channel family protein [Thermovirgaceae bacterium]|nr:mechanosensitive ion channel family protein [Thermovirgaceae bacterium]